MNAMRLSGSRVLLSALLATMLVLPALGEAEVDDQWEKLFQVMYGLPRSPKDSRLEQLKTLIDQGADVNMAIGFDRMALVGETRADLRGVTWPLDVAVQQAQMDMVKLLLAKGAKIRGKELAQAASARNQDESLAMITALLKAGADVNSRDNLDIPALAWAIYRGSTKLVKLLLAQPGLKLDEIDPDGHTALMTAAEHGHTEIVEMLLKAGANVSITDELGQTAATFAQKRLERQQAELEKLQAVISWLQSPPK